MAHNPKASHPKPNLAADRAHALTLTPVSRETAVRLDRFVELLLQWQRTINLIAPSTIPTLWTRHIADSLQLLTLALDARTWVDLGSGAGFPGLVIACAMVGIEGASVHLVESNAKKVAFLREATRHAGAPAYIHAVRIEDFVKNFGGSVDIVTARALAPLDVLLGLAYPLMKSGAQGMFLKGQDVGAELTEASKYWSMDAKLIPSKTDALGRIVVVRRLEKRSDTA